MNAETTEIDHGLFDRGFETYQKYADKDWGLVDCISFVVMWEGGITEVLTFDGDFEQAGFVMLKHSHKSQR
jgi:predicted nucleic acid-binding protein